LRQVLLDVIDVPGINRGIRINIARRRGRDPAGAVVLAPEATSPSAIAVLPVA
jgi:hypothetical protein